MKKSRRSSVLSTICSKQTDNPCIIRCCSTRLPAGSLLRETIWLQAKAHFYTWLNLDARFTSVGQGYWGLRTMAPQKGSRQVPLLTLMHKSVEYDDSPTRTIVRDVLDEEPLVDKDLLEGEEPDADNEDQDELDEEIDLPEE